MTIDQWSEFGYGRVMSKQSAPNGAVPATEFKTHALRYLDRAANGEEIVVSKHGQPVAKLVPLQSADFQWDLEGSITILDPDLELPDAWDADTGMWLPH